MYIQVNIGRNIGDNPMSDQKWDEYIEDVVSVVDNYREHSDMGFDMPQVHLGKGEWDGRVEDSAHISLYHEGGFDLDGIRAALGQLRDRYRQDSIALIIGSVLI